ncbi:MAG: hypothetical protein FWD82_07720 [Defluviitaleaceae bacterium]|nr:hypothetical protein [Defluviitaleaceae bacterium]
MYFKIRTRIFYREFGEWLHLNNFEDNNFEKTDNFHKQLFTLIQEVALNMSEILQANKNLKNKIKELVFIPCKDDILEGLKKYVEESDSINLEGYVQFRLSSYLDMIDVVLYMIIKNGDLDWLEE